MDGFKRPRQPQPLGGVSQPVPPRPTTPYEQRLANQAPPRALTPQPQVQQQHQSMPLQAPVATVASVPPEVPSLPDLSLAGADQPAIEPPKQKRRHLLRNIILVLLALGVVAAGGAYLLYQGTLQAADPNDGTGKDVEVRQGDTLAKVADNLEQKGLIRSSLGFQVYARLSGGVNIKESTCVIKASQSVQDILAKLEQGCNDFTSIMFYPGATIEKPLYKPDHAELDQTMYIKYVLSQAGYNDQQIATALNKQYTGPLFADKPAGTGLEGYIYGETYHVDVTATADQVLQTTFDQMYKDLTANDLIVKFKNQGLNLYQGITMASIVQRELNCEGKPTQERKERCYQYQRTIAQIFLKRLNEGDMLGSDVTFIYAADMKGVTPRVDIDSPYNTRINRGLPPGPIASPGLLALKAVGNPTDTDYHYFIAGDDGLIYFARTEAEHEANIRDYCQILCNEL